MVAVPTALTLDEPHSRTLREKAAARGQSPALYVQALFDADAAAVDEILKPIRGGFDPMGDGEIDALLARA